MQQYLRLIGLFFVVCVSNRMALAQTLSEEERREGFRSMLNGKDLTGWRIGESSVLPEKPSEVWSVENGVIKLSGKGGPNLGSQWDYEDFEMRFEWRGLREKYNSGFYIRSSRNVGSNQINLAHGGEGKFFGGKMKGGPEVPKLQKPAGEWNEWRVLVVGDKVTFSCNGMPAWEGTEFESKRGYVGLQTEGAPLEFRNLRIREIGFRDLGDDAWKPDETEKNARQTADKFGDYVLRLEFKAEKGQTGRIALRGPSAAGASVRFGDLEEGSGGVEGASIKPAKKADVPLGLWNYLEVRLAGSKLAVWLNGQNVVVSRELKEAPLAESGPIGLFLDEGRVAIQNLRIRETGR